MCILILKEHGHPVLKKKIYKTCFDRNDDGAGYAWWDIENEIWKVKKGFMSFRKFWKSFNSDCFNHKFKDTTVMTHFRIGTSGIRKGPGCTHPFPVTFDFKEMHQTEFSSKHIAFHNGVIGTGWQDNSDTMVGVQEYIAPLLPHIEDRGIKRILGELLEDTRCRWIITNGEDIHQFGKWIKDKDHPGHEFSNESYKPKPVVVSHAYTRNWPVNNTTKTRSITGSIIYTLDRLKGDRIPSICHRSGKAELYLVDDNWDWAKWDEHPYLQSMTNYSANNKKDNDDKDEVTVLDLSNLIDENDTDSKIISPNDLAEYFILTPPVAVALVDIDGNVEWEDNYESVKDMVCCPSCGSSQVDTFEDENDEASALCKGCGAVFSLETGEITMFSLDDKVRYCEHCLKMMRVDDLGQCIECERIIDYGVWGNYFGERGRS